MKFSVNLVARNSFWLFLGRLTTAVLNLLLTVLIARYLGDAEYGRYAFIVSLAYLGNTATTFGMDTLVMRSVARHAAKTTTEATAALILQLALSGVYIAILWLIAMFLDETAVSLRIYLLILIPLAFGTIYSAILRGAERMELHLAYVLTGAFLQTAGAALILAQGGGLIALSVWVLFAQSVATILANRLIRVQLPHLRLVWRGLSWSVLQMVLQTGWVLAVVTILAVLFAQLPILLLRALADEAIIGIFSAASRLVDGSRILPMAIFGALFPALARGANQSMQYRRLFWGLVGLFIGGIALGIVLADWLIPLLYGGYETAVPVFQILLIGLIPFLFSLRDSFELITQGEERRVLWVMLITVLVALPIFYNFIHWDALRGAAWAVVLSTTVQAILLNFAKRKAVAGGT